MRWGFGGFFKRRSTENVYDEGSNRRHFGVIFEGLRNVGHVETNEVKDHGDSATRWGRVHMEARKA